MKIKNLKWFGAAALSTIVILSKNNFENYALELNTITPVSSNKIDVHGFLDLMQNGIHSIDILTETDPVVNLKSLYNEKQIEEQNKIAAQILKQLGAAAFNFDSSKNLIVFSGSFITTDQITDQFYENLNLLLSYECDYQLQLCYLDDQIDFSKVDLTHVKKLSLQNCGDHFNYDNFTYQLYSQIDFYSIPAKDTIRILETSINDNTSISYLFDSYSDRLEFVKYLVDHNISINSYFQIGEFNHTNCEMYYLLAQLDAKRVSSYEWGIRDDIPKFDLDLELNGSIEDFNLSFSEQTELGKFTVSSNNPDLKITLSHGLYTENTSFDVPDNILMWLSGSCTDSNAFINLENIHSLYYFSETTDYSISWQDKNDDFDEFINQIQQSVNKSPVK